MNLQEVAQRYNQLQAQFRSGQLSHEEFVKAVDELRAQDAGGRWWQMDVNGGWLFWNGSAWVASTPPGVQEQQLAAPHPGQGGIGASGKDVQVVQESWQKLQGYVLNPRNFMREFQEVPLLKRSRLWWDALSVFGGAVSGGLWFMYSSIRGVSREGLDLMTPLIMVILPLALALLRSQIDKILLPLQRYRQRLPRLVLVGAGLAAPFVVAQLLYGPFTQYMYLRVSIVVGTFISYLILRTPQVHQTPDMLWQNKGGSGT